VLRVLQGNCREVLPTLPAGSVHTCITSPPYHRLRASSGAHGELGQERTPQQYIRNLVRIFGQVRRVLRPDGLLWVVIGDRFERKNLLGLPWQLAFALQHDGWLLRSEVIISKPNCRPESIRDRPTRSHEHLLLFSRTDRYFFDAHAVQEPGTYSPVRNVRSVWTINNDPVDDLHWSTFAPELAERCIRASTSDYGACPRCGTPWHRVLRREREYHHVTSAPGKSKLGPYANQTGSGKGSHDIRHGVLTRSSTIGWEPGCDCEAGTPTPCVVLDCFAGSGTTLVVARDLKRHAVGIEIDRRAVAIARRRLRDPAPLTLPQYSPLSSRLPDRTRRAPQLARTVVPLKPVGARGRAQKRTYKQGRVITSFPRGTSAAYRVARLWRDHPEIAEALARGAFKSVAEAWRAAQADTERREAIGGGHGAHQ
jgi:site-specific DNA-methyltransferase (cytosine-N4-specific)